jgi:hypothetical protein
MFNPFPFQAQQTQQNGGGLATQFKIMQLQGDICELKEEKNAIQTKYATAR